MRNEVVKHHNDLNSMIMRKWTSEEMNFFFSVLSKAREHGTTRLYFDTYDLKELSNFSKKHNQRWEDTMENVARKVTQLNYVEKTDYKIRAMTLFNWFEVDLKDKTVEIELSNNFEYILNRLSANFTTYELAEFTAIRSTYAKTMYRLLKQWRTIGKKEFKIEEFKVLLDMPKYYGPSEIDRAIIKPTLQELTPFFKNLKVKKIKRNTRGNPVTGYLFTWQPEHTEPWLENKYDEQPLEYATKYENKFTEWLIDYGVVSTHDHELIEQFKLEVYPLYQQLADRATLETVEKHISYVARQRYKHPVGYFKKAAKDYLKKFI